jgi:hypothetical protein
MYKNSSLPSPSLFCGFNTHHRSHWRHVSTQSNYSSMAFFLDSLFYCCTTYRDRLLNTNRSSRTAANGKPRDFRVVFYWRNLYFTYSRSPIYLPLDLLIFMHLDSSWTCPDPAALACESSTFIGCDPVLTDTGGCDIATSCLNSKTVKNRGGSYTWLVLLYLSMSTLRPNPNY